MGMSQCTKCGRPVETPENDQEVLCLECQQAPKSKGKAAPEPEPEPEDKPE